MSCSADKGKALNPLHKKALGKSRVVASLIKDGVYTVTDDGRIINLDYYKGHGVRECRTRKTVHGYLEVHVRGIGKIPVHRVIAIARLGLPLIYMQVNHINGIKDDNRPENLEWATAKENINHAITTGLKPVTTGEHRRLAKLTREQVLEIKERLRSGESHCSIAGNYNIGRQAVSKIANGSRWGWVN